MTERIDNLDHRGFWSTKQVCQRYGGASPRSLTRYRTEHGMPAPVTALGKNLYSIPKLLAWEVEVFGETVFPKNWESPEAINIDKN